MRRLFDTMNLINRDFDELLIKKTNRNTRFDFSSTLKKRRHDLDFTLAEASEGICSLSYLSKVENNQLAPSTDVIADLMEKLSIPEDIFKRPLVDVSMSEIGLMFLREDVKVIEDIRKKLKSNVFLYPEVLLETCLALINKKYLEAKNFLETIAFVASSLNFEQLYFYLLLVIAYDVKRAKLEEVKGLIEVAQKHLGDNEVFKLLLTVLRLEYYYQNRSVPTDFSEIEQLIVTNRRFLSPRNNNNSEAIFTILKEGVNSLDELKILYQHDYTRPDFSYLLNALLENNRFKEIHDLISSIPFEPDHVLYLGIACLREGRHKRISYYVTTNYNLYLEYFKKVYSMQLDPEIKIFMRLFDYHLNPKNTGIKSYLFCRDVILPYLRSYQRRFIFSFFFEEFVKSVGDSSHYKSLYLLFIKHRWLFDYLRRI